MRLGKYQVLDSLGKGGMGRVYLAHDPQIDRRVAIKVLEVDESSEGVLREARAAGALSHPNIVTIYDVGRDGEQDFIAMEYLPGQTLRDAVASGDLPRDEAVRAFAEVAQALASAHDQGVMHRDVKPDNVMVTRGGRIKVVDFGIARQLRDAAPEAQIPSDAHDIALAATTQLSAPGRATAGTATIHGTPAYMAPEVLRGDPQPASDVYALGVTMYETLSGQLPYAQGDTLLEMLEVVVDPDTPPRPIRDVCPDLSPALAKLIDSTLVDDPAKRPTMRELAAHLEQLAGGEVSARRPRRWHALAAVGAVAVGGLCVAVLALGPDRARKTPVAVVPFVSSTGEIESAIDLIFARRLADALEAEDIPLIRPEKIDKVRQSHDHVDGLRAALQLRTPWAARVFAEDRSGQLAVRLELFRLTTGEATAVETTGPLSDGNKLVAQRAGELAAAVRKVEAGDIEDDQQAIDDYLAGVDFIDHSQWTNAIDQLKKATDRRPEFGEAWYQLALAYGWANQTKEAVEAAEKARTLYDGMLRTNDEPPLPVKIMAAYIPYIQGHKSAASRLLRATGNLDQRDVAYLLAEIEFHRGNIETGLEGFRSVVARSPSFGPASEHLWELALLQRDKDALDHFVKKHGREPGTVVDFALRHYDEVRRVDSLTAPLAFVLGRESAIEANRKGTGDHALNRLNLLAYDLFRGADASAKSELAAIWRDFDHRAGQDQSDTIGPELGHLGELLFAAGWKDETRRVLDEWDDAYTAVPLRSHLAIHSAVLLGPDVMPELSESASSRLTREKRAVELELAGDREGAIALWRELLAYPQQHTYGLMQLALARNLAALGRTDDLETLCKDIAEPPIFRMVFVMGRAKCRQWLGAER